MRIVKPAMSVRGLLWVVFLIITFWLLSRAIVPGGEIIYSRNFSKEEFFVGKLTPKERVRQPEAGKQRIIGDPVYFSLRTPRRFDTARMILRYRRPEGAVKPVTIETGVLVDKTVWRYDLNPLDNQVINELTKEWTAVSDQGVMLLQKNAEYESLIRFLAAPPPRERIAVYNYNLSIPFTLDGYEPSGRGEASLDIALRGAHEFFTYIKDEDLVFSFTVTDLNENRDPDPIDVHLYYEDALIESRHLDDDGITDNNGETRDPREILLKLQNLPEGAYKLEVRCNDDIIIETIDSIQSKLAFNGRIYPARSSNRFLTLWTDSEKIQAKTTYPDRLQTIGAGEEELPMTETFAQHEIRIPKAGSTTVPLFLDRDGVILTGDGVFSFGRETIFNPRLKRIRPGFDPAKDGVEYVIARYRQPEIDRSGWKTARAEFDLTRAYREDGRYGFIISLPGLKAEDGADDYVEIDRIEVEMKGRTLWEKLGL